PLELASGLIALDTFSQSLGEDWMRFNEAWKWHVEIWKDQGLGLTFSPSRFAALGVGALIVLLLYRRIEGLGRLTVVLWVGVLATIAWILVEGVLHFNPAVAFDTRGVELPDPLGFTRGLGQAMILAIYAYLGYYNVCYIGDEVRDP